MLTFWRWFFIKKYVLTVVLLCLLIGLSAISLFVGVIDIDLAALFSDKAGMELKVFLLSRISRLLAIICTGVGMSVAGLIMQQLCMNKFVSPTTGATIQSAQFGIMLSLVFIPNISMWGRMLFSFTTAILGTWIFVWFIQKIKFKGYRSSSTDRYYVRQCGRRRDKLPCL